MLVAFDSSFLIILFDSRYGEKGNLDPRLTHLLATLDKEKATIIIPAPALSEVLVGAGDAAPRYLAIINASARFKVAPFAERAAVEAAAAHREAIKAGDKKEGSPSWAKVKYDRQIVSIALVEGASVIYSNDRDIRRLAAGSSLEVVEMDELPEPPPARSEQSLAKYVGDLFDPPSSDDADGTPSKADAG
ncbi:type II toxin-antitoxin system VapC family toxin [Methylobacterium sp. SD274]|uniref:type II toxin-antitoxin system VapC family toxin n=1 Tax=Methylobacterium sp. SD274 TaxID=2782009 RepID=UPI001A96A993|nr:type II toxin-antitoxin system VapC family toxin [Methylobacterium sp. SD274]MBO1020476.1 type II toxin-antitoxin system VapC family toxin [Methylobacterium sp. SD274]